MPGSLRVLTFGAGAIGTYIGGSLALAGNHVVFLDHPTIADELRQRGLRLVLPTGEKLIPRPILAGSLEEALVHGPFDITIFALKSFDTQTALESLVPQKEALPPFLCLQNGVENEPALAEALGEDRVIAGTVTSAVGRLAAGDIVLERLRGMGVAAGHPLSSILVKTLNMADLNAQLYSRAVDMKWSKMLINLPANATSAILDMTPAEIFSYKDLYLLEIAQLRETLKIMRAMKLRVVDLPRTPVRLFAFAVRYLPPALAKPFLQRGIGSGRGRKMPSFHIDLHAGRAKTEVDYLNGAVVRMGAKLKVRTPTNQFLTSTLLALSSGDLPLQTFAHQPEKLLKAYAQEIIG